MLPICRLSVFKTCDLNFFLLSQILLKIKWNEINTEKYFLFSNNNYFKVLVNCKSSLLFCAMSVISFYITKIYSAKRKGLPISVLSPSSHSIQSYGQKPA